MAHNICKSQVVYHRITIMIKMSIKDRTHDRNNTITTLINVFHEGNNRINE